MRKREKGFCLLKKKKKNKMKMSPKESGKEEEGYFLVGLVGVFVMLEDQRSFSTFSFLRGLSPLNET